MADIASQQRVLKFIFSLPTFVLRLMAGRADERDGRVLDPRLQLMAKQGRGAPPMSSLTPEQARAGAAQGFALAASRPDPSVRFEPLVIPAPHGEIPARLYRPKVQDPSAPVMVWMHQGGDVIGDLETSHVFCTILAADCACLVLSIDYRLAPEHPFPHGLEDALAAYRWARDNASRLGARGAAVGGDSQGGNFAAVICQDLKRSGEPQPVLQLLVYPAVDMASETQSMSTYADSFPLSADTMRWFLGHQIPPGVDPTDLRLSPLRAPDLSGLAPAVVVTAGFDPLTDQGEAYAHRLVEAGVPTLFRCYASLSHAFLSFGLVPAADIAAREIAGLARQAMEGRLHAARGAHAGPNAGSTIGGPIPAPVS